MALFAPESFTQDTKTSKLIREDAALNGVILPPGDLLSDEPPSDSEFSSQANDLADSVSRMVVARSTRLLCLRQLGINPDEV